MKIEEFLDMYHQLPEFEKSILEILSIVYVPINQTNLIDCLGDLSIDSPNGMNFKAITEKGSYNAAHREIRPYLEKLVKDGFFESSNRSNLMLDRSIVEIVIRECVKERRFPSYLKVLQPFFNLTEEFVKDAFGISDDMLMAIIRIYFYQKKIDKVIEIHSKQKGEMGLRFQLGSRMDLLSTLIEISCRPFDQEWFEIMPNELQLDFLEELLKEDLEDWTSGTELFEYIKQRVRTNSPKCNDSLQARMLDFFMLQEDTKSAEQWLKTDHAKESANSYYLQGWFAFLRKNYGEAIRLFEESLKRINGKKKKQVYFDTFGGILYILALFQSNTPKHLHQAEVYLRSTQRKGYFYSSTYLALEHVLYFLTGKIKRAEHIFDKNSLNYISYHVDHTKLFFLIFCYYWIDKKQLPKDQKYITTILKQSGAGGFQWFYNEISALQYHLSDKKTKKYASSILETVQQTNLWEHKLNALLGLESSQKKRGKTTEKKEDTSNLRMVWFLEFNDGRCNARPREQKLQTKGTWSKGRPIALKNLMNTNKYPYATDLDMEVLRHIEAHEYRDGWYGSTTEYIFDPGYIFSLIGHPLIFWEDGKTKVELTKGKPELIVAKAKDESFKLSLSPKPTKERERYQAVKESPTRIKIIKTEEEYHRIAAILKQGITVPAQAEEKVLQVIKKLASDIVIHSEIGGVGEQMKEVPVNSKIYVHLLPAGRGLKLSLYVRPFAHGGAWYEPGKGGTTVIAEINGKTLQTTRTLSKEREEADLVIQSCPTLRQVESRQGEWLLEEPEDCLELLLEMGELEDRVVLEWPEGVKFKLAGKATPDQFRLNIKQEQDWFAATGTLHPDEKLVIDLKKLLELTDKTPGRFLEIKKGEFIALTQEFRKRLEELNRYSERKGKGVRFHPLAALALEGLTDEVGQLRSDKAWKNHIEQLRNSKNLTPQLPSTFQAELRDYQSQGFDWLSRLSHWGVGACLADDMGLGKTIQALAMLLQHAPNGPSLVVAPTSVCANWFTEAQRFAPTLNLIQFGNGNRKQTVDSLGTFDVLVCSYGLLQQERVAEMLSQVTWEMAILDEAQAIKNYSTKRSQAAMKLDAKFKLITTGTPIENHLGELWNLFHFINPGLLHSIEQFNRNFATPIEKEKDSQAKKHLKKLIQPFLLRRRKSEVLEELPARTEIGLQVELSKEELAFYEALRQQALENLAKEEEESAGKKHLKILAEIMKLRRACCNTALVNKEITIPSSKLAVFGELVEELLEGNHKALVFSQFVSHLALIREYLDEKKISYQYLDGSTPAAKRKEAVDSFQSGQGDLFLISLKAGGVGLNLTAADYVIHMDPWWNPAVEDQASDRAHRIGQKRPVTIYRLVAKETIEEKIVDMHRQKRDLADSLLEGSDMSGKISTETLLKLITH